MRISCVRKVHVEAPAETVFESLSESAFLFSLNVFHKAVECETPFLRRGSRSRIDHRFFGLYRERRVARVHRCGDLRIAWSELADQGRDWFPHSQSFTIQPLSDTSSVVRNELRGRFLFRGARLWTAIYRFIVPRILDAENRKLREHLK